MHVYIIPVTYSLNVICGESVECQGKLKYGWFFKGQSEHVLPSF